MKSASLAVRKLRLNRSKVNSKLYRLVLLLLVFITLRNPAVAQAGVAAAVYTMSDLTSGNSVIELRPQPDGTLVPINSYSTGGLGNGGGLGNQGALALSDDQTLLFVVNPSSNDFSVFQRTASGLTLVSRTPSGGSFPLSISSHKGLVYVLNAGGRLGGTDMISGFTVTPAGAVSPIAGSTRSLSSASSNAAQVAIAPDATTVLVTEKGTSTIDGFSLDANGVPSSSPVLNPSSGSIPYGFSYAGSQHVLIAEDASRAVSSYGIAATGALTPISRSVATTQTAVCWLADTPDLRFAYTANTGSSTISSYSIGSDGTLQLLSAIAATADNKDIDITVGGDGKHLYAVLISGAMQTWSINADGSLTPVQTLSGLPATINGVVATGFLLPQALTTLTSSANPQNAGSNITFTAKLAQAGGTGVPTGDVTFFDGNTALASVPLDGTGTAQWTTSTLLPGMNAIAVTYVGDQNYAPSSAVLSQTVYGPPALITAVSGSGQRSAPGTAFANALVTQVVDAAGDPIAGVTVTYTGSGLSFSNGGVSITGADGRGSVTAIATTAGAFTAFASVNGLGSATFSLVSSATTYTPLATFYSAGSSAQFDTFALAAVSTGLCGTNTWTQSKGASIVDSRSFTPPIPNEAGDVWIAWNNQAAAGAPGGIVCYYVSTDSVVGLREYFASATVTIPGAGADSLLVPHLNGTAPAGVGGVSSGTLPAAIQAIVNGTRLNAGVTDIRPEDAKFATNRALTAYAAPMVNSNYTGVGYQGAAATPWLGQPIQSSQSNAQANPVDWSFFPGTSDPITHAAPRPYREADIGAAPVIVVANVSNNAANSGGLGDPNLKLTGINKYILNSALLGKIGHARDLAGVSNYAHEAPLHVWIREPLSGAYNTMEFSIPNSVGIAGPYAQAVGRVTGQEANINAADQTCSGLQPCQSGMTASGNPLYQVYGPRIGSGNGSSRGRVIGTAEMIRTTNSIRDSLGYAFWDFGSFAAAKAGNLKYLLVDGVDPLYSPINPNPGGVGVLPQCPSLPCILPFDNIKNGQYPIWSKYRLVYDPTDTTNIATNLVILAQTASTTVYSDFVPATALNVFRSHYSQVVNPANGPAAGVRGNNGIITGIPESGGDMGGVVLTKQSEMDFYADSGHNQQVNLKQ